jgi:predicted GNAT family acetyltransferase
MTLTDWQKAQAYFRTNPLKYLVHLKYMNLYGDSITCSFIEREDQAAILLRYPTGRVVWAAAAYPTADQELLPTAESAEMADVLLEYMRQNGLLGHSQVIKFCDADTKSVMCKALNLTFARALTSYTSPTDVYFTPDSQVMIEAQPREAHLAAFIANGYSREEVAADFAKGATLFSLYDEEALLSTCMAYLNFDSIWEIAGVHTADPARRKGYGRRVVQTALWDVLRKGFTPRYQVEDVNRASIHLAEGLGLQPCLHFRHYVYQPSN